MIRLAFLMLGSQEQAEDVVLHDALARLVERWDRVQNHGAYLRTSVVIGSRSVLRRRRLLRQHPATEFEGTDPEADYLADLLEILTPTRRAVVVLRYFEQLAIPEIARTLGVREGTVKSSWVAAPARSSFTRTRRHGSTWRVGSPTTPSAPTSQAPPSTDSQLPSPDHLMTYGFFGMTPTTRWPTT